MYKLLFSFSLVFIFFACGGETTTQTTAPTPPAAAVEQEPIKNLYPTLPLEKAEQLFKQTDYMDYVFYELPFSMNHSKDADIKNAIRYISTSPVTNRIPQCKSIGRIFYQAKGEIIGEAEFHFNSDVGCFYMVFMEEGKSKYANLLTDVGVGNYSNIFSQVQQ